MIYIRRVWMLAQLLFQVTFLQSAWLCSKQEVKEQVFWPQVSHCNSTEYDKSETRGKYVSNCFLNTSNIHSSDKTIHVRNWFYLYVPNEIEIKFCLTIPTHVSRFPVGIPSQALTGSNKS